jgi:outer membrane lipoprotein
VIPKRTAIALLSVIFVFPAACASGVSQQARSQVTYRGSFSLFQKNPDRHVGAVVMFGGKILETKASPTSSEITLLQLSLGKSDRPQDADQSEGRFLLRSEHFLDPATYRKGTMLTAVGKVTGSEVRSVKGFDYAYPVIEAIETKIWSRRSTAAPPITLGVGVGSRGGGVGVGVGF